MQEVHLSDHVVDVDKFGVEDGDKVGFLAVPYLVNPSYLEEPFKISDGLWFEPASPVAFDEYRLGFYGTAAAEHLTGAGFWFVCTEKAPQAGRYQGAELYTSLLQDLFVCLLMGGIPNELRRTFPAQSYCGVAVKSKGELSVESAWFGTVYRACPNSEGVAVTRDSLGAAARRLKLYHDVRSGENTSWGRVRQGTAHAAQGFA